MGYMKQVTESKELEIVYHVSYHGLYCSHKSTTMLRTVFSNTSRIKSNNNSLNSIMYNVGVIQDDLFTIMVRFRKYVFVFTTYIHKIYRMIKIRPHKRFLQRIEGKNDLNVSVKTCEISTVTHGTICAPYLVTRTLVQLSINEGKYFPIVAPILSIYQTH